MFFIAHRGNINGKIVGRENTVDYITEAIKAGFDCEIDIWYIENKLFLGHDYPENLIDESFLFNYKNNLWIHCKNIEALCKYKDEFNCFFHDKDQYTITSKGFIWGNIGVKLDKAIVSVMPELSNNYDFNCKAICSDYVIKYREIYNKSQK